MTLANRIMQLQANHDARRRRIMISRLHEAACAVATYQAREQRVANGFQQWPALCRLAHAAHRPTLSLAS